MRRRFLADEIHGSTASLTGQNAAHLARVLRARIGQEYEIAANGVVRMGKIVSVSDDRVEFELGGKVEVLGAPSSPASGEGGSVETLGAPSSSPSFGRKGGGTTASITLLAAIFKFDRFEWAVEKATELGVARIVPVIARRTDAHLAQAAAKRVERWRRIAHEASQQSRRIQPPDIADPVKLKQALGSAGDPPAVAQLALSEVEGSSPAPDDCNLKILLAESEEDRTLRSVIENAHSDSIALAVGPEGGWTDDELQLFANSGWISASLGPTILRAETALVAALAVVRSWTS